MSNIYFVEGKRRGYDVFKNAVIIAKDEDTARLTHPNKRSNWNGESWGSRSDDEVWNRPETLIVTLIGKAQKNIKEGVVNSDFNAG